MVDRPIKRSERAKQAESAESSPASRDQQDPRQQKQRGRVRAKANAIATAVNEIRLNRQLTQP
ncbi:uncharacterized protein XM38_053180 [Halomicronema hongdechloris C2206]|uniref:Uncharacterized protein n=1 Tax=Halomicronema hongdechloris C2206 TaxID=1641165 RepID=A0A1Z3HVN0_9CYAN|nr:hypothetical protein [Halomicronema hongdechloris]ASC74342.1 uncharacterized protein XM38_053180 [Halomicronema hongdechloris C2206]